MKKPVKILLGIASLWPILYLLFFFVFMFSQVFFTFPFFDQSQDDISPFISFAVLFALHLFTMAWITGLMVFYIVNVFRNDRIAQNQKALWAVVLFLGNMLAMPVYWYLYIWREPKPPFDSIQTVY